VSSIGSVTAKQHTKHRRCEHAPPLLYIRAGSRSAAPQIIMQGLKELVFHEGLQLGVPTVKSASPSRRPLHSMINANAIDFPASLPEPSAIDCPAEAPPAGTPARTAVVDAVRRGPVCRKWNLLPHFLADMTPAKVKELSDKVQERWGKVRRPVDLLIGNVTNVTYVC